MPFTSGGSSSSHSQGGFNANLIPVVLSATQGHNQQQSTHLHPVSSGSSSFGGSSSYSGSSSGDGGDSLIPLVISATLNQHSHKFGGSSHSGASSHGSHSSGGGGFGSHTQAILPVVLSQHGQSQGHSSSSSHSSGGSFSGHSSHSGSNSVIPVVVSALSQGKGGSSGSGYSANQIDNAFEFSHPQKSREISSFTVKSQQRQSSHSQSAGQHPGGPYP